MNQDQRYFEMLKKRGLTCAKLETMEKKIYKEVGMFRSVGFRGVANAQEKIAKRLERLRRNACKLR